MPSEIRKLEHLRQLIINDNNLNTIPQEIKNLTHLSRLELNGNNLTELPNEVSNLTKLKALHVGRNKLISIPKTIGKLKNLQWLDLSKNKITKLPAGISKLINLTHLDLRDNELPIPPEILNNFFEPKAILLYYFLVAPHGSKPALKDFAKYEKAWDLKRPKPIRMRVSKPLGEIKLLLVGQGSVGKTSLVQQILHGTFDQNQTKTEGISINQWSS